MFDKYSSGDWLRRVLQNDKIIAGIARSKRQALLIADVWYEGGAWRLSLRQLADFLNQSSRILYRCYDVGGRLQEWDICNWDEY